MPGPRATTTSTSYVDDLASVIDMDAIRGSGLRLGVDPLGGASVAYWPAIRDRYGLDLTITNEVVDPQFGFMTCDWDGRIRMDPSSPYAMARLVELRDRFDVAFANDTDADRHGIVTPSAGLMNPNHFLSVAVAHLFGGGRDWRPDVAVGKTLVSSAMLDRVAADLGRRLLEVPVGFKWFVAGLVDGSLGFGGEESAGASFLRRDGTVWTTDKDGIIACLLAAEMTARSGRDPGVAYAALTERFGDACLPPHRCAGDARPEGRAGAALARAGPGDRAGRGAGDRDPDHGARQRGTDRRGQGDDRERLVRGPAVRHGERLQDLRRELPRRGPSRTDHRGGTGGGREGPGMTDEHEHDHDHEHEHDHDHEHDEHDHDFDYVGAVEDERARKDDWFKSSPSSPLPHEARHDFAGLPYFAVDPALRFEDLTLEPYAGDEPTTFQIPTSDGQLRPAHRAGTFTFELDGAPRRLTAYVLDGGGSESLFVPFLDATSGRETYGAGRHLELEARARRHLRPRLQPRLPPVLRLRRRAIRAR